MHNDDRTRAKGRRRAWHWLPWRRVRSSRIVLNLALQGGGAHGAFTWGVLDRLLEEEDLRFEGLSGASAGAMNAVVFASGWLHGGREGAQSALHRFWQQVSVAARLGPLQASPLEYLMNGWNRDWSPGYLMMSALAKVASPYQFNPGGFNPLHGLLEELIDFEALHRCREPKLFIAATSVHSGMPRILRNPELNAQAVIASACLPLLFHAVRLGDEHYWDGGYTANPPLFPLLFECAGRDVLLVQLEPSWRPDVPTRVTEIVDRANEIAFNANLMRELQLLAMLQRPRHRFPVPPTPWGRKFKRVHMHHIEAADTIAGAGRTSRANTDWGFLQYLRDLGRARADEWLREHRTALGCRSSMDLQRFVP